MMIASATTDDGGTLLVLGLSAANVERMKEGYPMDISRESHGLAVPPNIKICIFTGETEASMEAMMRTNGLIGPETVMNQKEGH